jgi:predicted GIY-YIG superfamily endonuclease
MEHIDKFARIYMLKCSDNYFYIGSTINTLSKRLSGHKAHFKNKKETETKSNLYKKILEIGLDNIKMELIEEFIYKDKKDILKKENEYIEKNINNYLCLNTKLSYNINKNKDYKEKKAIIYKLILSFMISI